MTGWIGFDFEVILISFCSIEPGDATYFSGFSIDLRSSFDSVREVIVGFSLISNSDRSCSGSVICIDPLKFDFSFNSKLSFSWGAVFLFFPRRRSSFIFVELEDSSWTSYLPVTLSWRVTETFAGYLKLEVLPCDKLVPLFPLFLPWLGFSEGGSLYYLFSRSVTLYV